MKLLILLLESLGGHGLLVCGVKLWQQASYLYASEPVSHSCLKLGASRDLSVRPLAGQDSRGAAPDLLETSSSEGASASFWSPVFILSPLMGSAEGARVSSRIKPQGSAIYPSIVGALCPHRGKLEDLKDNN